MTTPSLAVTPDQVRAAAAVIDGFVVRTPSSLSRTLSAITGAEVVVKFESLQFTGSYKERGALNRLRALDPDQRRAGIVTASAGNFAQGIAHHSARLGIPATIVMPVGTPSVKAVRTAELGARVVVHGDGFGSAWAHAVELAAERGLVAISPFDDPAVIAGQGTVGLELLAEHRDLEVLAVPVGGGGLLAGISVIAREQAPRVELVGVQTDRFPSMVNALTGSTLPCGGPTIAEGIAVPRAGTITSEILRALDVEVVTVTEAAIEEAVCLYLEIEKVLAEGAGATALAALVEHRERFEGRKVGVVLSGANIDLRLLASVITRGLVRTGRLAPLRVSLPDEPGALGRLASLVGECGANIVEVRHERAVLSVHSRAVQVDLTVETSGPDRLAELVDRLGAAGYAPEARPDD